MKKLTPVLIVAIAAGITAMVLTSQFGYRPGGPSRLLKASDLTPAEIKFGRSPKRDRSVVYQADVVVMENGTDAIRSLTPDGLGCVLDAGARHADDLTLGKIAFITSRCVGRIVSARRDGNALTLVLAPVEITDIFRKLDVTLSQPLDLTQGINYAPAELPGASHPLDGDDAVPPDWETISQEYAPGHGRPSSSYPAAVLRNAAFTEMAQAPGILPPVFKLQMQAGEPIKDSDGLGVEFRGDKYGLRTVVQVQLRLDQPWLEFSLHVDNGAVDSKLVLHNAAGLKLAFDSAVDEGGPRRISWYAPVGSKSFPLSTTVPLAFDIRQDLYLDAQFLSGSSSFSAGGNYDFNADIGFTYQNKNFTVVAPKGLTVTKAVMNNMTGVSIAPRRFAIRHAIIATAGLGGAGFTIGPQLILGTRIEVKEGGDTGIVQCKGSRLKMGIKGGVGWTIPQVLAKVVNFFLNLLRTKPIKDHGGIHTDWKYWVDRDAEVGGAICGTPGG
jgi:hypothetical protein